MALSKATPSPVPTMVISAAQDMAEGVKNKEQGQAEVGWLLGRSYQGRGIATEAVKALLAFGFESMGLHRIYARTGSRNVRSWRLMERVGMRREAHLRQSHKVAGEWDDEFIYAVLADEWSQT